MELIVLRVPAIHCDGCVNAIKAGVNRVSGVQRVEGDSRRKTITVEFDPASVDPVAIEQAVEERGFSVEHPERITGREALRLWQSPLPYLFIGVGLALLIGLAGYLVGFRGFVYGIAMPQAFGSLPLFTVAAISGVAAFFSPCVFPLLPGYVAYALTTQGHALGGRLPRSLYLGALAGLGIVTVNMALGGLIAAVGAATPLQPDPRQDDPIILLVRFGAGTVVTAVGVLTLTQHSLSAGLFSGLETAAAASSRQQGLSARFFLYGLTYNAAGIGCTGPILLGLMLYAFAAGQALVAFLTFSLTMVLLMVAVTALVGLAQRGLLERLRGAAHTIQQVGGGILIAVGVYTMLILSFGPGRDLFVRVFLPFLP